MYEIRFVLRLNAQSKKTNEFPVNLEVTLGNQRPRPYSTDVTTLKTYWNNGKVSSKDPLSFSKNEKLSQIQILANEILLRLKLDKKLTYENFHAIYKQSKQVSSAEQADVVAELVKEEKEKEAAKHCLFTYFEEYINREKVLRGWSTGYVRSFKSEINKWRDFHKKRLEELSKEQGKSRKKGQETVEKPLYIEDVTEDIVIDFIGYMRDELDNDVNTIYRTNKRSRQVFEDVVDEKLISDSPYKRVKLKQVIKIPIHLTITEVDKLEALKIQMTGKKASRFLLNILNYFLFACYTGLRYQTLESLTHKEVYDMQYIEVFLDKTKTPTIIPLSERAKACLPEVINPYSDEKVFNVKVNQYGNRELKIIALMAGMDKKLTHHTARHTFATSVCLSNGVPLESLQKMLGHKSIRTTQIYAKIVDIKLSEDMHNLEERLKEKQSKIEDRSEKGELRIIPKKAV